MSEQPDTLETLARVPTEMEAALIVQHLADRGITATHVGGFTAGFRAEAPGDVAVLVRRRDLANAQIALAEIRRGDLGETMADEED